MEDNNTTSKNEEKKKSGCRIFLYSVAAILLIIAGVYIALIVPLASATKGYNTAVQQYNALTEEYSDMASKTSVENIENFPANMGSLNIVEENIGSLINTVLNGNSIKKIKTDTQTVYEMIDAAKQNMLIMKQITAPSEEWIMSRIKAVDGIGEVEAVTSGNDPNAMLNKKGGYTSCIYFTLKTIDTASLYGIGAVGKGTDAGGCIEVFGNLEDAEARCDYLSGFDNSILYSGSYAIIGTSVVRISYILDNEQQYEMTGRITQALTRIE